MASKTFFLAGETPEQGIKFDMSHITLDALQNVVASHYGIIAPQEIGFQDETSELETVEDIRTATEPISITVSGKGVRETPGPDGLPYVGSYLQVFPDHLGNDQRLFEIYGPVFKTTNMGVTNYMTNDPQIAQIVLPESEFFSKEINKSHPLYPIKNNAAGVFLADSSSPNWTVVHKFMPPALGPKAVRHYSPVRWSNPAPKYFAR